MKIIVRRDKYKAKEPWEKKKPIEDSPRNANSRTHKITTATGIWVLTLRSGVWKTKANMDLTSPAGKYQTFDFQQDGDIKEVNKLIQTSGYELRRESLESYPTLVMAGDNVPDIPNPMPQVGDLIAAIAQEVASHEVVRLTEGWVHMRRIKGVSNKVWKGWIKKGDEDTFETPDRLFWIIWRRPGPFRKGEKRKEHFKIEGEYSESDPVS